jgi:hypothetical protein
MKYILSFTIIFLLAACQAGTGEGLDDKGLPINESQQPTNNESPDDSLPPVETPEPPIEETGIQANLASIQEHVFTPICSTCHGGANPAAGQNLSSIEQAADNLIGVNSSNPLFKRVVAGDAEQSYLYLKITGNNQAGARMPLGQTSLPEESIEAIKQWINDGAVVPSTNASVAKVSQVSNDIRSSSVSSSSLGAALTALNNKEVVVDFWFNQSMDLSTLTEQDILVTSKIGSQEHIFSFDEYTIDTKNDHLFTLTIHQLHRSISNIKIQLNNNNIATLTSSSGQMLDGNNDGIEGGVYLYEINL